MAAAFPSSPERRTKTHRGQAETRPSVRGQQGGSKGGGAPLARARMFYIACAGLLVQLNSWSSQPRRRLRKRLSGNRPEQPRRAIAAKPHGRSVASLAGDVSDGHPVVSLCDGGARCRAAWISPYLTPRRPEIVDPGQSCGPYNTRNASREPRNGHRAALKGSSQVSAPGPPAREVLRPVVHEPTTPLETDRCAYTRLRPCFRTMCANAANGAVFLTGWWDEFTLPDTDFASFHKQKAEIA